MKRYLKRSLTIGFFLVFSGIFLTAGCSQPGKTLDTSIKGPQMVVNPDTIRLGVARLTKAKIAFSGAGFQPGDSVFIKLLNVPVDGKKTDLSIASADIEKNGTFTAPVGTLAKVSDFLRASIGSNEKMENIIVITGPPMPPGTYTARAISMLSDKKAECTLTVKGPSLLDRLEDWIGTLLGKIVKK